MRKTKAVWIITILAIICFNICNANSKIDSNNIDLILAESSTALKQNSNQSTEKTKVFSLLQGLKIDDLDFSNADSVDILNLKDSKNRKLFGSGVLEQQANSDFKYTFSGFFYRNEAQSTMVLQKNDNEPFCLCIYLEYKTKPQEPFFYIQKAKIANDYFLLKMDNTIKIAKFIDDDTLQWWKLDLRAYVLKQDFLTYKKMPVKSFDELNKFNELRNIAAWYDYRAIKYLGGQINFNEYQKMQEFYDEYNVKRYKITTFYKNMSLNEAYQSYVKNSIGEHFENHNYISKTYTIKEWPLNLPSKDKVLKYTYNQKEARKDEIPDNSPYEMVDIELSYKYLSPKRVLISYQALNAGNEYSSFARDYSLFTLEFAQEEQGTYLTLSSKALPVSFNCNKATKESELALCKASQNEGFTEDIKMHYLYNALKSESFEDDNYEKYEKTLNAEQKAWLNKRDGCKSDFPCIKKLYLKRNAQLQEALNLKLKQNGYENCKRIHDSHYDGRDDFDGLNTERFCEFKNSNILAVYELFAKAHDKAKIWAKIERLKTKKDFTLTYNDYVHLSKLRPLGSNSGDINADDEQIDTRLPLELSYKWLSDKELFFEVSYEYSPITYTFIQDKENVKVKIEENILD